MSRARFAVLTFAFLLASSSGAIHAEQPEGVIRTFLVMNLVDENVDFSSEDSVLLKVNQHSGVSVVRTFGTGPNDPLSAFNGKDFGFGVSAMYITRGLGDTPVGVFAWLLDDDTPEPPPVGSVALLGPDAVEFQSETFHVTIVQDFLSPSIDEGDAAATIVTAVFTK